MIYAYDLYAQMPVRDLYDSQIMSMAISIAKDMYDRSEREIEKFRDKYGSFYSPTQSHMDYYNQNFNVGLFVDDLYNKGIDPLRSSEGRAAIRRWVNTRPIERLEQMKKSAENYEKYQENVAKAIANNEFNPEFENFLLHGRNINDLKVGETWDRIAPTRYQDLNQYTGHLFDKMEDDFMGTDETGKDWYGVSADRRRTVLTPMMGDLLSTDLGRFHYEQARANAASKLNRTPTEKEVMQLFADDIITATREYDHRNWKENPEYKRKREFEYANKLDAIKQSRANSYKNRPTQSGAGGTKNGTQVTSYGQTLLSRGIAKWAGSSDPGADGVRRAQQFGMSTNNLPFGQRQNAFVNFYSMNDAESPTAWISRFDGDSSRTKDAPTGGVNCVPSYDNRKLFTKEEMTSRTVNYPGGSIGHSNKNISGDDAMIPTGRVYTAPMRDGTFSQFVEVNVGNSDKKQTLWYKVTETEPVNVVEPSMVNRRLFGEQVLSDKVIAPAGYSTIPSQETVNQWSIQDRGLNKAVGLGADTYKQGTGYFIDNTPN